MPLPTQQPLEYGVPISLDLAKRVMAAAEKEALANHWRVVIAIVDSGGHLVMLHKLDNSQLGSLTIARLKAETALNFKRSTKTFEETLASGGAGLKVLSMPGVTPLEGGILLMQAGKIIGAIGVSGVRSPEDAQVANAGAGALND